MRRSFLLILFISLIQSTSSLALAQDEGWSTERDRDSWKATSPRSIIITDDGFIAAIVFYQCVIGSDGGLVVAMFSKPVEVEGTRNDPRRNIHLAVVRLRWGNGLLASTPSLQSETISDIDDWRKYLVLGTEDMASRLRSQSSLVLSFVDRTYGYMSFNWELIGANVAIGDARRQCQSIYLSPDQISILQPPTDHVPEYAPHLLKRPEFPDVVSRDVLIHVSL